MPTTTTALRAGKPTVNLDQGAPVQSAFVIKHLHQLTPARIRDRLSELDHISHSQVFHKDGLVFTHQSGTELVQKISATIGNFGMLPRYLQSRLISVFRPLLLAAKGLLNLFELATMLAKVSRIGNLLTRAKGQQASQTHINPNSLSRWWQSLNGRIVHQQRHKPATRGFKLDRNGRGFSGKITTPNNIRRLATLSQVKLTITELKTRFGKLRTTAIVLLFEAWITSTSGKEASETLLQMPQTLLQGHTTDLIEKLKSSCFFHSVRAAEV